MFPQNAENTITVLGSNSTLSIYPKAVTAETQTDICATMLTAVLQQKAEATQVLDEQINKMWFIHIMEHYSVIKWDEILRYATTCMNLDHIKLSEISYSQKGKYCMIPPRRYLKQANS